jgi:alanyl-tRNA synthetase
MTTSDGWTSRRVRETFLSYFEGKGHTRVASSSLVPAEDPTLLFTNAGMNQFKDLFLGREKRAYVRAASSQKCVRAGGKHNDLDNVGYTARHHTFFEMLGNFSFGDYFKTDAIEFAWELVTSKALYGLDPNRLWATVYTNDDEAAALWAKHLPGERVLRFGEKDNFWSMGETGPCGPCTELHYDQGPSVPGDDRPNGRGDRVMEIWNLVFMQFDRDASGKTTPLPKPSVDTGAGLERITAILQGKNNNYDTDLFAGIIARIEEISGKKYVGGMAVEDAPFRVIADHARAAVMLIADGVIPSNEGRGYVLRRIIRRAARYGRRLGLTEAQPILADLAAPVLRSFEGIHVHDPDGSLRKRAADTIRVEEEGFRRTMSVGADRVGEAISAARREGQTMLSGPAVFRLYDTFGVPLETIEEIASDEGVHVDTQGFEGELSAARERSKGASKFEGETGLPKDDQIDPAWTTEFRGYPEQDFVSLEGAKVLGLLSEERGERVDFLRRGEKGWCVLDRTVSYPEGGGQVADHGEIRWSRKDGEAGAATVLDTRRAPNGRSILHLLRISAGSLASGQMVSESVDEWTRRRTQANHTGTHLLHAALRRVLGDSVRQMGSRRTRSPAVRLRGVAPDDRRGDPGDRAPRERGGPAGPRGVQGRHADGRGQEEGRDDVLRREVRGARPRRGRPRIFDRALRRLPRGPHGRDRRLQDPLGQGSRRRRPPDRGGDVAERRREASERRRDSGEHGAGGERDVRRVAGEAEGRAGFSEKERQGDRRPKTRPRTGGSGRGQRGLGRAAGRGDLRTFTF